MAHIIGTPNSDNLLGTADDDLIEGLAGNDTLIGYSGDDTLDGGTGADTMSGYQGDDLYYVDNVDDVITGDDYSGTDEVRSTITYTIPANIEIENLTLIGTAAINGTGNELNNVLTGNSAANVLTGGPGTDTVDYSASPAGVTVSLLTNSGSGGNAQGDTLSGIENLIGSAFVDTLTGDSGPNVLAGRGGADTLIGDADSDTADYSASASGVTVSLLTNSGSGGDAEGDTLSGIENLTGSAFADTLTGDSGANVLFGGLATDTLYGGDGDDTMDGDGNAADPLMGVEGGDDTLYGGGGNDRLYGNLGDDTLYGGDGNDALGNFWNDLFSWGSDTLYGGEGDDTLYFGVAGSGGPGNDIYYVIGGEQVIEANGEGTDEVVVYGWGISGESYTLGANVENLSLQYVSSPFGDPLPVDGIGNELANGITGNDADNVLSGLGGNDTLNGGAGFDTAIFSGAVGSYHFASNGAQITVTGPDGTDTLTNIEQLSFANLTFSIADRSHFDPLFYLNQNPDIAAGAIDPLTHYQNAGWAEGRDPNPNVHLASVDGLEYIASYADLMAGFGANKAAGYQHFATHGLFEGRTTTFDGLEYIASYTDLLNWLGANSDGGATHYIQHGSSEGRTTTFDGLEYIASYADLLQGYGANADVGATHYIQHGLSEGRTTTFDGLDYIASYADLLQGYGANADVGATHYIEHGFDEGRHITFDPQHYLSVNADLLAAVAAAPLAWQDQFAAVHYIEHGDHQGRLV